IASGDKLGIYYLNPSFRVTEKLELSKIYEEVAFSSTLIKKALEYIDSGNSVETSVEKVLANKKNWQLKSCSGNKCSFIVDTGYSVRVYDGETYEEKPLELKFALTISKTGIKTFETFSYDTVVLEQPQKPEQLPLEPQEGPIEGIDISHWQGTINWPQVKQAGKQFVFIKATEGTNFLDDKFYVNIKEAKDAGLLVGAYHFARPDANTGANGARQEARYFAQIVNNFLKEGEGYLRPVLDLERSGSGLTEWVHSFMEEFKSQTGVEPILYTNPNYLNNILDSSVDKYGLWVANYGVLQPTIAKNWDFWQYSDSGTVPGINNQDVDLDIFKGRIKDLRSKYEIGYTGDTEEPPEVVKIIEEGFEGVFPGIRYKKVVTSSPRPLVYYITKIDLTNPKINFVVTPYNQLGQKTSNFLALNNLQFAINGDESISPAIITSAKGFAASNGNVYSNEVNEPTIYISQNNQVQIGGPRPSSIWNAISGSHRILEQGYLAARIGTCSKIEYCSEKHPRTAVGVSQDGKTLIVIVVDGRQPGYSEGVSLPELAQLQFENGAYDAINMDGGGSTTLVMEGKGIVNTPIHSNVPGTERTVVNHLGIKIS
ncbi:MAG: GH25 family lysozyme, partial [Nanoarchaeota archaeon]